VLFTGTNSEQRIRLDHHHYDLRWAVLTLMALYHRSVEFLGFQRILHAKVRSLGLFLVQQVLYDNATALVIEGIARHDSGTNFKEDSAIGFFYTNGQWVSGHELFVVRSLRCQLTHA
jgi:hypothetical protein